MLVRRSLTKYSFIYINTKNNTVYYRRKEEVSQHSVKGKKRKNKYVVEKYHRQEKEDEKQVQPKKQKITEENNNNELVGIPIAPPTENNSEKPSVIFILEKASLEVAKVGKTYQLLNSDDHADFLHNHNKNPNDYRPDICHQALLHILDSPLNQAGRLKMVYIRTEKGLLIEVKPYERAPRTFKRFAGVMLELLQKSSISPAGKQLLRTIKYPVTQYLPINSRIVGLSFSSKKLVNMKDYLSTIPTNLDLVFVILISSIFKFLCLFISVEQWNMGRLRQITQMII
ncbi:unnamed protein product [Trifolium pratense]|uniref:Uncharacterized protein n=1 Tax=Trifolium pratense TaxID=57577 RepID=A0ACB0LGG4_TRIPR|nr:unnamed protein product [Trifolium pratense]